MQWWYEMSGETKGPVEGTVLKTLVAEKVLDANSLVVPEGSGEWGTVAQHAPTIGLIRAPDGGYVGGNGASGGSSERKDWNTSLILSVLLGELGVDRFYLGYTALGVLKLITFGGCGIWWIIDVVLIAMNNLPDAQGRPLDRR